MKHIGLTGIHAAKGLIDYEEVVQHFMKVNGCDRDTFEQHRKQAFKQWEQRSQHQWKIDLGPYQRTVEETGCSKNSLSGVRSAWQEKRMWKNRIKQALLYLILAVPVIWLMGGIVLYLHRNVSPTNWQSIFLLQNSPFWSVALLFLVGLVYWMSANHHWAKVFKWLEGFKTLNRITQATILLSATFYISLLVAALLFPRLTGFAFQSDWALLLVATVPLLALVVLLLVERATSVKAKFAGIEVEFQRTITALSPRQ